jgi:hypothetical protein
MKSVSALTIALAVIAFAALPAAAGITIFNGTDFGATPTDPWPNSNAAAVTFDASTTLSQLLTFESLSLGNFTSMTVAPGVTATLTNCDVDGGIRVNDTEPLKTGYNTTANGTKFLEVEPVFNIGTASLTFTFDSPATGFGAYLTGVATANGALHVTFNDGAAQDLTVIGSDRGGVQFFGFTTTDQPFTSVTLELRGVTGTSRDIFGVDDVRLTVPEPATLSILALGGISLKRLRRRA